MRYCIFFLIFIVLCLNYRISAENYLLNGGQKSNISYKLIQQIDPTPQTVTVDLTFVLPKTFISPTFKQQIRDLNISFSLNPDDTQEREDKHGKD